MTTLTGYSRPLGVTDDAGVRSPGRTIVLWILQVGAAAMFLAAGVPKLLGAPVMVQMFNAIGIGQWFRYLTGSIEVLAGLSLLVPSVAFYGAIALAVTMVGAIATHLFIVGGSAVPAIVLLAVTSVIALLRRPW